MPGTRKKTTYRQWVVYLPALIAAIGIFIIGLYSINVDHERVRADSRSFVTNQLNLVRARLEGAIFGNIQLVRSLVAIISIEPNLSQSRFVDLGEQIFQEGHQLRNVAAAPDLVVSLMYPLEGNEKAIGLDYRKNDAQREAAFRARDLGELIIAGPLDLVQGGRGLIGRVPVFKGNKTDDPGAFWGLVAAVIDVDKLYEVSGLSSNKLPIEIAIRGADATGPSGRQFYGPAKVFGSNPVLADVNLPYGSWQIAAIPEGGWPSYSTRQTWLFILLLMVEVLIVAPMVIIGNLLRERHVYINQLEATKLSAEKANMAKSEFLASMSHELRTPLNAILGYAQMLQYDPKHPLSKSQNGYVESICSGGDHLLELVNDVLDLAKIEANQFKPYYEEVSANEVVKECVSMTRHLGDQREIKVIDQFSSGTDYVLYTDQLRLKQVLLNLLTNAIKFNDAGGKVIIDGHRSHDRYLRISVIDTGIGIARKDFDRVFQMFQRVGSDPMIARDGYGIGLTVTKLLVERMMGRIGFESEEGGGSTFWVELPISSLPDKRQL